MFHSIAVDPSSGRTRLTHVRRMCTPMCRRRDAQGEPSEAIPTVKYVDRSECRRSLPQLSTPFTDYSNLLYQHQRL
jgi:hypothetical protein